MARARSEACASGWCYRSCAAIPSRRGRAARAYAASGTRTCTRWLRRGEPLVGLDGRRRRGPSGRARPRRATRAVVSGPMLAAARRSILRCGRRRRFRRPARAGQCPSAARAGAASGRGPPCCHSCSRRREAAGRGCRFTASRVRAWVAWPAALSASTAKASARARSAFPRPRPADELHVVAEDFGLLQLAALHREQPADAAVDVGLELVRGARNATEGVPCRAPGDDGKAGGPAGSRLARANADRAVVGLVLGQKRRRLLRCIELIMLCECERRDRRRFAGWSAAASGVADERLLAERVERRIEAHDTEPHLYFIGKVVGAAGFKLGNRGAVRHARSTQSLPPSIPAAAGLGRGRRAFCAGGRKSLAACGRAEHRATGLSTPRTSNKSGMTRRMYCQ